MNNTQLYATLTTEEREKALLDAVLEADESKLPQIYEKLVSVVHNIKLATQQHATEVVKEAVSEGADPEVMLKVFKVLKGGDSDAREALENSLLQAIKAQSLKQ